MLERLPLQRGVLYTRAVALAQEQNQGAVSGVPVGRPAGASRPTPALPVRSGRGGDQVEYVESTGQNLTRHEALAGLVEYVQV